MPGLPTISVIIPVKGGGDVFRQCLASLAQMEPRPAEVFVVADGPSDGSAELAEEAGAKVLRLPACGGPAHARNVGAQEARGEILLFLDADVTAPPGLVGRVAEIFAKQPELAAVIGSYDDAPGAPNFLSQYKNLLHHYVHQTSHEEASTFWTGCGAIRREVLLELGGFDESYRVPSVEDIEFGYQLIRAGHRVRLVKDLQVKHLKHWGILSLIHTDFARRALPWTRLILRTHRLPNDLNVRVSGRASVALAGSMAASLLLAPARPAFLGLAAGCGLALLAINLPVYRFFARKRGLLFAIAAVPWHWLYFFYSGLAFALGFVQHVLGGHAPVETPAGKR
ncbi:MAG: glycosyltransferase family 2 protein [Verrucomicrobia bacterium]|nr:glycosyltransferase family 2 protein [Verrucomicrobiota bacterium]